MKSSPGKLVKSGMNLFQDGAWPLIGFLILTAIISLVLSVIPFIGSLVSYFYVSPLLAAGPFYYAHQLHMSNNSDFNLFFKGFSNSKDLLLYNLIKIIGLIIIIMPVFLIVFPFETFFELSSGNVTNTYEMQSGFDQISPIRMLLFFFYTIAISCLFMFLLFVVPLIAVGNRGFVDAIKESFYQVRSNFGSYFVLLLLLSLINIAGALLCGVGLIATIPITQCTMYAAYIDAFPEEKQEGWTESFGLPEDDINSEEEV